MKAPLFIALLVLAGAAFAQEDAPAKEARPQPAKVISGQDNPELIPEWVALQTVLIISVQLDSQYPDGAALFAKMVGISEDAARAVIGYERARQEAWKNDTSFRDTVCTKRAQLTSSAAFKAEMESFERITEARTEANVLGVYSVLSAEGAEKLRAAALKQRRSNQLIGVALPDADPTVLLNAACGR